MSAKDRSIRRLVEEGLGNAGRLKIIHALASGGTTSQTKYGLERATGLSPSYVRKHLKVLVETGWVKEYPYNPQVYTVNLDDPKAKSLVEFFKKIDYI